MSNDPSSQKSGYYKKTISFCGVVSSELSYSKNEELTAESTLIMLIILLLSIFVLDSGDIERLFLYIRYDSADEDLEKVSTISHPFDEP